MNNNGFKVSPSYLENLGNQQYMPNEESFIENVLRINKGKRVLIYQTFPNSDEWKDKTFTGIIERCGKDHIILSDPNTGGWYMLLMKYIDFIKFDEEINSVDQFYSSSV